MGADYKELTEYLNRFGGRYDVTASRGSLQRRLWAIVRAGVRSELNLGLGDEPQRTEPRITGVVLDSAGHPMRGAWLGTRRADSLGTLVFFTGRESGSAVTDEDGRFEVQPFGRLDEQDSVTVVARAGSNFGAFKGSRSAPA